MPDLRTALAQAGVVSQAHLTRVEREKREERFRLHKSLSREDYQRKQTAKRQQVVEEVVHAVKAILPKEGQ